MRKLTFGMNVSLDGLHRGRCHAEDGDPMDIAGATLAAAAMRAGLIDEYVLATALVLVVSGTPFLTPLDNWVNLNLVETRYETWR